MSFNGSTTFDYSIAFSKTVEFYPDATDLAGITFAIIVVSFTAAVGLKYATGEGTTRYRKSFLSSMLLILIFVQYYQLWFALLQLPVDFTTNSGDPVYRYDCLNSEKGGKRSHQDYRDQAKNPCWLHVNSTCVLEEGTSMEIRDVIYNQSDYNKTFFELCDVNGPLIENYGVDGGRISKWLDDERDCR